MGRHRMRSHLSLRASVPSADRADAHKDPEDDDQEGKPCVVSNGDRRGSTHNRTSARPASWPLCSCLPGQQSLYDCNARLNVPDRMPDVSENESFCEVSQAVVTAAHHAAEHLGRVSNLLTNADGDLRPVSPIDESSARTSLSILTLAESPSS